MAARALAQSAAATATTTPTLAERLERLAAEFDRNRIDLHVPGAVLLSHRTGFASMNFLETNAAGHSSDEILRRALLPVHVSLDAETGDVFQTPQAMWVSEVGAMPTTTIYSDYREVGGLRLPYRTIESTEMGGRIVFEVECVEVGVELAPDAFTLPPSTNWGRKK